MTEKELRDKLAKAVGQHLDEEWIARDGDAEAIVDALLPVVAAYVEQQARERAADTLADVLGEECRNASPFVRAAIADRAAALRGQA